MPVCVFVLEVSVCWMFLCISGRVLISASRGTNSRRVLLLIVSGVYLTSPGSHFLSLQCCIVCVCVCALQWAAPLRSPRWLVTYGHTVLWCPPAIKGPLCWTHTHTQTHTQTRAQRNALCPGGVEGTEGTSVHRPPSSSSLPTSTVFRPRTLIKQTFVLMS